MPPDYKPHLPNDKNYRDKVAQTMKQRQEFETLHFEYLTEVLNALGFSQDPYSLTTLEDLNVERVAEIADTAFKKIQEITLTDEIKEKLSRLWDYISAADPLEKADVIFVFGGLPGRAEAAIELWKQGWAPKIFFTGNKASYMEEVDMTEAEYDAKLAIENGVPHDCLILEKESRNTPENVINSLPLFHAMDPLPEKIILVTANYHMLRAYMTFKAGIDWNPKLLRRPADHTDYNRENYFYDQTGWTYAFFEYVKMYVARLMKHF